MHLNSFPSSISGPCRWPRTSTSLPPPTAPPVTDTPSGCALGRAPPPAEPALGAFSEALQRVSWRSGTRVAQLHSRLAADFPPNTHWQFLRRLANLTPAFGSVPLLSSMPWLISLVALVCCAATVTAYRPEPPPAAHVLTRRAMVLAPVGDSGQWPSWLTGGTCDTQFDLGIVHYGNDTFFSCPECKFVWHARGPKWRLVYQVLNSPSAWRQVQPALVFGSAQSSRCRAALAQRWRSAGAALAPPSWRSQLGRRGRLPPC